MKIAQIAPIVKCIPPKMSGGIERIVYLLCEELVERGHDVTLFATGDSLSSAKIKSITKKPVLPLSIKDTHGTSVEIMHHIGYAYDKQDEFDIIHDHNDYLSLPTANLAKKPVIMTLHLPIYANKRKMFQALNNPYLVTISKAQSVIAPNLNHLGTVYNGLAMDQYPFSNHPEDYLLFAGTLSKEKGADVAIAAAEYLDMQLILLGPVDDYEFYNKQIKPKLSTKIRWLGEGNELMRNKLMSKALAFLSPTSWREPFGLTLIEAQACGCPVVAFRRGSTPEVVSDKQTGFVVEDFDEMLMAIENIRSIDRKKCREFALENFNAEKMVDGYELMYQKAVEKWNKKTHTKANGKVQNGNGHLPDRGRLDDSRFYLLQ